MIKRDGGIVYEKLVWDDEEILDTQTNQPSAVDDELKEIFKTIFGERDVWEVIDREGFTIVGTKSEYEQLMRELHGDNYKEIVGRDFNTEQNKLTAIQKKMFLKKVCDGKYTENDLIFIRAIEDFSSGFAFTKDAFCIGGDLFDYQTSSSKFKTIPYEKITDIEFGGYSSDWAERRVPTLRIKFKNEKSSYYGAYNADDLFFNVNNVRNKYSTPIITEGILWQIGKFLEFVKE